MLGGGGAISSLNSSFFNRFTHMVYGCFEPLKLLDECENIIYLDFDILIRKSIAELFKLIDNYQNIGIIRGNAKIKDALGFSPFGFDAEERNYLTGFIVFNKSIKKPKEIYEWIYRYTSENISLLQNGICVDQGVFTLAIKTHCLSVCELSPDIYCGNTGWIKAKNSSIIHAFGVYNRFWNNRLVNLAWNDWERYYQKWLSLGGSAYEGEIIAFKEVPKLGGEIYQFFDRLERAKRVIKIALFDDYQLISTLNFYECKFIIAGINEAFLEVNSTSISNFILLFSHKEYQEKKIIERKNLEKELPSFIENNLNKFNLKKSKWLT